MVITAIVIFRKLLSRTSPYVNALNLQNQLSLLYLVMYSSCYLPHILLKTICNCVLMLGMLNSTRFTLCC